MAWDDAIDAPRPGVMVCHAWAGRGSHEEDTAKKLAEMGYVGFAADVYGKGVLGQSIEENSKLMTPFMEDRGMLQNRLRRALDSFTAIEYVDSGKVAVMGYCFGGLCAIDMARTNASVQGVAAFHAVIKPPALDIEDPIVPRVIAFQGYEDPMADADAQRAFADEMTARKADWQLHLYGGVKHAFTNPGAKNEELGLVHNAVAAKRAWKSLEIYLSEVLQGVGGGSFHHP